MFHPPQAAIGLALLPMAWAASERARAERGATASAVREDDLERYFPAGWQRDTVPDWAVFVQRRAPRAAQRWLSALLRSALRAAAPRRRLARSRQRR